MFHKEQFELAEKLEELLNKMECAVLGIESDEAETAEQKRIEQDSVEQKSLEKNGGEK